MRRRILRSNVGPTNVNASTKNDAVFHIKTSHGNELSRLTKNSKQLPVAGQGPLPPHDMGAGGSGILLNAQVQPQMAERRTRREVRVGTLNPNQIKTLMPVPRKQQDFNTFDGQNNIRFKIHVTDKKGAVRPTKILATLANGALFQRQDGLVNLTRTGFNTPIIREIASDEEICTLGNDRSSEKSQPSNNVTDLWKECIEKNSEHNHSLSNKSQNRARYRNQPRRDAESSHATDSFKEFWIPSNSQDPYQVQPVRGSPDYTMSSPDQPVRRGSGYTMPSSDKSSTDSEPRSENSLTRSNETRSNIYGNRSQRREYGEREKYQQGASILKTSTSNAITRRSLNDIPFYPQEDGRRANLQPVRSLLPPLRQTVQPCIRCQFAPCSACRTPICVVCMAETCVFCRAPLCSACTIESYSANNETLCMACTASRRARFVGESPLHRSAQSSGDDWSRANARGNVPTYGAPRHGQAYEEARDIHRLPGDFPPLPPGYPNSLSPCSPYIDWEARRNLPPLIPNYVCEPLASKPEDGFPDNVSCNSASIMPRKNKFLELLYKASPPVPACGSSSSECCCCCCGQAAGMEDTASVIYPTPSWYPEPMLQCRTPSFCETSFDTLFHVMWIIIPVIALYVVGFMATVSLMQLNKFTRLAAVMANMTLLYILILEPDDLIAYPTDKPRVKKAGPCPSMATPCSPVSQRALCMEQAYPYPC
ncbi:hypothetical protein EGW08_011405 [Elysia chlorotica]|uniref:Uncharacterized protein n=1 Tax=Elysia chlorotica TaxID=188477 RepID=A0A3S1BD80_ELYCH|nr:hypothetical protein EGW08_011405 [Elysia chlorotica]